MNQEHEDSRYADESYETPVFSAIQPRRGSGRLALIAAGGVTGLVLWLIFRGMYLAARELVHFF
jgi:hypothetical protein